MKMYDVLKRFIKQNEPLYSTYQSIRYPKAASIKNLFRKVNKKISSEHLSGFFFDGQNSWVRVYDNLEFLYVESQLGGLLGLERKSGFETTEIDFLKKNFRDGGLLIDIGANFGLYSVFTGKKFPNSQIHSFEPVPDTFKILSQNIEHNGCNNVKINNLGLSYKKDTLKFTNDQYAGNHIIFDSERDDLVSIDVTTLDGYAEENHLSKINFIKCDVEGAELFVLQGAKNIIERDHPLILIEIYDGWTQRFNYSAQDVIDYLTNFGYSVKVINAQTKVIENYSKGSSNGTDFIFFYGETIAL
ncbi:MAG: FkbM family methyltransferase [Sulfuricurvum sp.]|uniref:FkbM family methyltransferase n=1 Tax=Sulfuricurvum sp. TaxID=2025608 RepID=UPI002735FC2D|nr:FkbM family methyltransferase [Sulfuricurvum sp.]MDP2850882.1 FkbM family methyltransferase [Sulfuricurvum sp.]